MINHATTQEAYEEKKKDKIGWIATTGNIAGTLTKVNNN